MRKSKYDVIAKTFNGITHSQYENLTDMEMNELIEDLYRQEQIAPFNIFISKNKGKFKTAKELGLL